MATILPNRAQISYSDNGLTATALSNQTNTSLIDQYTMEATKTAVTPAIVPGSAGAYIVRIDNTGSGALYNPSVVDDLGDAVSGAQPLIYVGDSAKFYLNGDPITGTAAPGGTNVTFSATTVLQPGDNLIIVYAATLDPSQSESVTNTITATANGGSASGAAVTATAEATITPQPYANVAILKAAGQDTVVSGDSLTYTFTLLNTGTGPANSVVLTDVLPSEFSVTSITYDTGSGPVIASQDDYEVAAPTNTLTFPKGGSAVTLNAPAASDNGPGTVTIEVTGTIS